jgi:uncharacterized protein
MPRKFFRKYTPSIDKVREYKALSFLGDRVFHPSLWHLNRRSAAGGVAVGVFCGLIPGPLQMLAAAIACVTFRLNLPVALVATLYTNPLTIVPLYLLAYQIGSFVLGAGGGRPANPPPDWDWTSMVKSAEAMGQWMVSLGAPLALGVFLLACILSALSYFLVRVAWNVYLRHAWHTRGQRVRR